MDFEREGHECVWSCEIDKYCRQVYRYRWEEPEGEDVREVDPESISDHENPPQRISLPELLACWREERGLRTLVGRSFTRYAESCGFEDPRIVSLRTSRVFSPRRSERLSESSSNPWTNSGMMRSGRCLTLRTSESPRTGPECSLRDILEENPDPKYYLSQEAKEKLLSRAEEEKEKED